MSGPIVHLLNVNNSFYGGCVPHVKKSAFFYIAILNLSLIIRIKFRE